jgi:excisionase family DNA binding protein
MTEEWMTIEEAAQYLKLAVVTVRKYVKSGQVPSYRQGRIIRLKSSDLDQFMESGRSRDNTYKTVWGDSGFPGRPR